MIARVSCAISPACSAVMGSTWKAALRIVSLRTMREPTVDERPFGKDFLWAMLARKS